MKLYWNFQRGGEVLEKIPSMGEVWIFSGTTQSGKQVGQNIVGHLFLVGHMIVQFEVVIVIYIPLFQVDQEKQQVTVQAGLTIQELNELLNDHGLALSK